MAYNPFDPSSRYRLPSWNLDNPLSSPQPGLGGALSTQQPTGITGNTFMGTGTTSQTSNPYAFGTPEAADWTRQNVGDVQYGRTPPRTTTDVSVYNTAPDASGTPPAVSTSPPPLTPVNTPTLSPEQRAARYSMESGQAANQRNLLGQSTMGTSGSRDARYAASQGGLGRATTLQSIMGSAPLPGGGGVQSPMGPTPGSTATSYPPTGPGTSPSVDARMTRLDEGLTLPKQSITPEDVMVDPGFKWQQEQLGRRLEDIFAAKGRVGSTDYFNTLTNANQKLISDEYNRINNQQWERGMEMNRLLYDRRAQENITNYEREFRENERLYGRQQAENILAYERAFREDARDYDRLRYLVQLGFTATQASTGT